MRAYLLIDFGSTYTKVTLVDAEQPALLAQAQAPTTADHDVRRGLAAAVDALRSHFGPLPPIRARLAASSAAGGLRLAAVGLVPDLTAEAARMAALGAGARVVASHAYRLTPAAVARLRVEDPDMILLAGGTDGGNLEVVLHNARMLAAAGLDAPVVYAGNAAAREQVVRLLAAAGIPVQAAANVMPRLGRLEVDEAREVIRRLFMEHIVRAKGLEHVRQQLDGLLMPTPAAVLWASRLLADGPGESGGRRQASEDAAGLAGLGSLLVVDIGGATTDVHSIGAGGAVEPGVEHRGLEEPYDKRTVEGDLGMRSGAPGLLEALGAERLAHWVDRASGVLPGSGAALPTTFDTDAGDGLETVAAGTGGLEGYIQALARSPGRVPADPWQVAVDHALARCAVGLAVRRHAGRLRIHEGPFGRRRVQRGKDLRAVRAVIGTGGVFRQARSPAWILEAALAGACPSDAGGAAPGGERLLLPEHPALAVDAGYLLAPMGLLAEREPEAAFILMKRNLRWLTPGCTAAGPASQERGEGNGG